jgi:hypothetical protein
MAYAIYDIFIQSVDAAINRQGNFFYFRSCIYISVWSFKKSDYPMDIDLNILCWISSHLHWRYMTSLQLNCREKTSDTPPLPRITSCSRHPSRTTNICKSFAGNEPIFIEKGRVSIYGNTDDRYLKSKKMFPQTDFSWYISSILWTCLLWHLQIIL